VEKKEREIEGVKKERKRKEERKKATEKMKIPAPFFPLFSLSLSLISSSSLFSLQPFFLFPHPKKA